MKLSFRKYGESCVISMARNDDDESGVLTKWKIDALVGCDSITFCGCTRKYSNGLFPQE
jgi:hypothetical protein